MKKKIVDKFRALFALFKLGWLMVLSLGLCFLYTINPHELYAQPKLVGVSSGPGSVFTIEPDSEKPGEWVNFGTLMNPGGSGTTGELTFAEGELYGMTKSGGSFNRGVIYKIDLDGTNLQTVAPFPIELRGSKSHQFYLDGKLWGTDNAFNKGTLYYLDLQDESINMVANFTDSTGLDPVSQLTLYDDKFWGITRRGGRSNKGTIYSVNSDGTDLQAVYHFSEVEGSGMGGITLSVYDGKMWGTSSSGGTNSSGFIFTYELSSEEFSIEHNFSPSDVGYSPDYGLVLYNDRLWGIMKSGGQSTVGGVYSIDPTDTVHSPKLEHSFGVEAGFDPNAGLLVGNMPQRGECLFGITAEGGDHWKGTIFIMDPDDGFIQTTSLGSEDFGSPTAGLTLANDKLYSMQQSLGAGFRGGLLALNLTNIQTERVYTSPREDLFGKSINTELFVTSTGHFIGVCSEGGKVGNGTIFSIDREGKNFTVLYDFPEESAGGILPKEIIEHKGRIFGVAFNGGNNDDGVIFSVDASGQFSVVHHFEREANGHFPELLTPFNGRIWGYTNSGGPNSEGVLYSLAEDGTDFKVEHAFGGSAGDGERPQGDLTIVGENLMGTTRDGGNDGQGTLYMIDAQN
ncbi:MAG: choice-of-anchor tandem repeat GloVer-containing protein, partial [Bacteroidota bacterium]